MTCEQAMLLMTYLGRAGPVVPVTMVEAAALQPALQAIAGVACGTAGNLPCSGDSTRVGVAAGGGVEYGITPNWSAKLEYLWIGAVANDAHINTVRGGINYRFGGN